MVDTLPQSDFPSDEEHFVAAGRRVILLVGVSNLEPGDLDVAHAPRMCGSLDASQHDGQPSGPSSDPPRANQVSAVTTSPLATAAATPSPSLALLERLTPEQRASFLHVWERPPSLLRAVPLDLHGPGPSSNRTAG